METTMTDIHSMRHYLKQKLEESTTISQLAIFIDQLLTINQLKYDLKTLLDHYYQVACKVNNFNNEQQQHKPQRSLTRFDGDNVNIIQDRNNETHTRTTTTTMTTTTVTKFTINSDDGYDIIRSLYLKMSGINEILTNSLCTKIISYIPREEYYVLSNVSKYFNYLICYDKTAQIYNESRYQIYIFDNIKLYQKYKYLIFSIDFNDGSIYFRPPINNNDLNINSKKPYQKDINLYKQKIRKLSDITEIPYYGINQWTLFITNRNENVIKHKNDDVKPKSLSMSTQNFQNELETFLLNKTEKKLEEKQEEDEYDKDEYDKDLIMKILENSLNGISCLSVDKCEYVERMCNKYPIFNKCIILMLKDVKFLNNPSQCLTYHRFPNLQYLELENISFDHDTLSFEKETEIIYQKLFEKDNALKSFDIKLKNGDINIGLLTQNINNNNDKNGRYYLLMDKILKVYHIIAQNFLEWRYVNDILCELNGDKECNLLSFKCSMKKCGFTKMLRILCKCIQQKNEFEQEEMKRNNNNNDRNNEKYIYKKREEIQRLQRELLEKGSTLRIPSTIEWLSISNMDCNIDLSRCSRIVGIQFENILLKQITFHRHIVIPAIALSIDNNPIFMDWKDHLNLAYSKWKWKDPSSSSNNNNNYEEMPEIIPVRFLFFNGDLKPKLQLKRKNIIKNNKNDINEIINDINEQQGIIPTMVLLLKQIRMSEREFVLKEMEANKNNRNKEKQHFFMKGDTNRDENYLCIYLDENQRKENLFLRLTTFALQLSCDNEDRQWLQLFTKRIDLLNIWWSNHKCALWIKHFGQ